MTEQRNEIEKQTLGAIFSNPEAIDRVAKTLRADDFGPQCGRIFFAMLMLKDKGRAIDYLTVAENLKDVGLLKEVGGPTFLLCLDGHGIDLDRKVSDLVAMISH